MKTDELKKELISAIEKAFEKYEPEPKFKVGQWVKRKITQNGTFFFNGRITRITDTGLYCGEDYKGGSFQNYEGDELCLMTVQEIESHLKKIAIEKGFKNGVTIKGLRFNSLCKMFWQGEHEHSCSEVIVYPTYNHNQDEVNIYDETGGRYDLIYSKGSWATILPSLKKKPETRKEFHDFINTLLKWYDNDNDPIQTQTEFLDQYDL